MYSVPLMPMFNIEDSCMNVYMIWPAQYEHIDAYIETKSEPLCAFKTKYITNCKYVKNGKCF